MDSRSPHVVVIGGGLGGLTLTQGLRRAGVNVDIYERDATADIRGQGYRIHLDSRGAVGLFECVSTQLRELLDQTSGRPSHEMSIVTAQLKLLRVIRFPESNATASGLSAPIDRFTVRQILLSGLGDSMHFNKEFVSYEKLADGRVRAHFANRSSVDADVLVGADGVGSRVRQQLLPQAELRDTGERCIFGKTHIDPTTQVLVPPVVRNGFTAVIGRHRRGMALGLMEFNERPELAAARHEPNLHLQPVDDYVMWALTFPLQQASRSDDELRELHGIELQRLVQSLIEDWNPTIRALVTASDPGEICVIPIQTAIPLPHWETTNVTLLGDAIHAMSPSGGSGANIALRDAALLCQKLVAVNHEELPLLQALHDYEVAMLDYGFAAVRESDRARKRGPDPLAIPRRMVDALRRRVH